MSIPKDLGRVRRKCHSRSDLTGSAPASKAISASPHRLSADPLERIMSKLKYGKYHRHLLGMAFFAAVLSVSAGSSALAADEPDLIFRRSTVFKWLSPNDKLATYGVDDP